MEIGRRKIKMKKYLKLCFSLLLIFVVLGVIFCIVDDLRVHGDEEPIFAFSHKIIDGLNYSAKVDIGLGYKIIRFNSSNQPDVIKVGTIFMSETSPYIDNTEETQVDEMESGETEVKITTFGEKYKDVIILEGMEEDVYAQNINSKLGYSMEYYYELFDYVGYEEHDKYVWNQLSGDNSSTMTIYNITEEKAYQDALKNIEEKKFEEISGEGTDKIQKLYHRTLKENDIEKVNNVYIVWLEELKLMVDISIPLEAQEGIGVYMAKMVNSID